MAPKAKPYNQFPRDDGLSTSSLQALDWLVTQVNQLTGQSVAPSSAGFNALSVNTIDPKSAAISSSGSRMWSVTTPIMAVLSTTGATFYWDGTNGSTQFIVYRDDGTQFGPSITGSPLAVSGLSANTKYFFYGYFDETLNQIKFVNIAGVSVGTPAIAFTAQNLQAAQQQILKGRIPLGRVFVSSGITTPNAGTINVSGGNGGGSGAFGAQFS